MLKTYKTLDGGKIQLTEDEALLLVKMRSNCKTLPFHPMGSDVKPAMSLKKKGLLVSGGTWPNREGFDIACQISDEH